MREVEVPIGDNMQHHPPGSGPGGRLDDDTARPRYAEVRREIGDWLDVDAAPTRIIEQFRNRSVRVGSAYVDVEACLLLAQRAPEHYVFMICSVGDNSHDGS